MQKKFVNHFEICRKVTTKHTAFLKASHDIWNKSRKPLSNQKTTAGAIPGFFTALYYYHIPAFNLLPPPQARQSHLPAADKSRLKQAYSPNNSPPAAALPNRILYCPPLTD